MTEAEKIEEERRMAEDMELIRWIRKVAPVTAETWALTYRTEKAKAAGEAR